MEKVPFSEAGVPVKDPLELQGGSNSISTQEKEEKPVPKS
jgi:hypothetical protein